MFLFFYNQELYNGFGFFLSISSLFYLTFYLLSSILIPDFFRVVI